MGTLQIKAVDFSTLTNEQKANLAYILNVSPEDFLDAATMAKITEQSEAFRAQINMHMKAIMALINKAANAGQYTCKYYVDATNDALHATVEILREQYDYQIMYPQFYEKQDHIVIDWRHHAAHNKFH